MRFNPSESMDLVGSLCNIRNRRVIIFVSILLSQWIWLEAEFRFLRSLSSQGFNPSESMDLVGSLGLSLRPLREFSVSILLSQWIWLEVDGRFR